MTDGPRIALCHEWITTRGGSERVAVEICRALDIEDVYVFTADPVLARRLFPSQHIIMTRPGRLGWVRRHWAFALPVMPFGWRRFDLSGYDIVITNAHSCANSVKTHPDTVRLSMCHTPMRYAWWPASEIRRLPLPLRVIWPLGAAVFRRLDRGWSRRVHAYYGNSRFSAERVRECYGVEAGVIHPPIDLDFWRPDPSVERGDYFLIAGRLVAYKEVILALLAANLAGERLIVAGDGPQLADLRQAAGPTVEFEVAPTDERLRELYQGAIALVQPGVEEFGMTMIEAAACGTPGLAFGKGGACETIVDGVTGLLYPEMTPRRLAIEMSRFDPYDYDTADIVEHADRFSTAEFHQKVRDAAARAVLAHSGSSRRSEWAEALLAMKTQSNRPPTDVPTTRTDPRIR
ncbi:MAG: glycosyltransferase family 4 protein [Actinomycetia bacterium]|nr:glycosyltransferase family 4 protein [Actinomycetes bacterium]